MPTTKQEQGRPEHALNWANYAHFARRVMKCKLQDLILLLYPLHVQTLGETHWKTKFIHDEVEIRLERRELNRLGYDIE